MKKFLKDSFLSILSSLIVVLSLQFIVLPQIAKNISIDFFGYILIVLAIRNVLVQILGGSLNNFLLLNQHYLFENDSYKVFNSLIVFSAIIGGTLSAIIISLLIVDYQISMWVNFAIALAIINAFYLVFFRLKLLYIKIFLSQIIMAVGYIIGLLCYRATQEWFTVILIPEILMFCYLVFYLLRDNYSFKLRLKHPKINLNFLYREYFPLVIANSINNVVNYLERIIFTPLLGAAAISQYYIVTLAPKTIALGVIPINGVILSYVTRSRKTISIGILNLISTVLLIFFLLLNVILYFISPLIMQFLYPDYFESVSQYIFMANLTITLGILATLVNPLVLKIAGTKFQMKFSLINGVVFILLGIAFTSLYGFIGFLVSSFVVNILKISVLLSICYRRINRDSL